MAQPQRTRFQRRLAPSCRSAQMYPILPISTRPNRNGSGSLIDRQNDRREDNGLIGSALRQPQSRVRLAAPVREPRSRRPRWGGPHELGGRPGSSLRSLLAPATPPRRDRRVVLAPGLREAVRSASLATNAMRHHLSVEPRMHPAPGTRADRRSHQRPIRRTAYQALVGTGPEVLRGAPCTVCSLA
jgi:hypothetical protein